MVLVVRLFLLLRLSCLNFSFRLGLGGVMAGVIGWGV